MLSRRPRSLLALSLALETRANKWRQLAPARRRQLVRANRAIESAERCCHFWCDAKTLQWQLKVITRAINAATAAAATAKKTQTAEPASSGSNQKWLKGKTAEMQEKQRQQKRQHEKRNKYKNARNLFVINWLAINQTITKMLSTLRHVNTSTNTSTNARTNTNTFATEPQQELQRQQQQDRKIYGRVTCFFNCTFAAPNDNGNSSNSRRCSSNSCS